MVKSNINPPESCGYVLRDIKLNAEKEVLEIFKGKYIENKIPIKDIKSLLLTDLAKALVNHERYDLKPSSLTINQFDKISKCKYVPLQLILIDCRYDLIMPDMLEYSKFSDALEEIIRLKKDIRHVINYYYKKQGR